MPDQVQKRVAPGPVEVGGLPIDPLVDSCSRFDWVERGCSVERDEIADNSVGEFETKGAWAANEGLQRGADDSCMLRLMPIRIDDT